MYINIRKYKPFHSIHFTFRFVLLICFLKHSIMYTQIINGGQLLTKPCFCNNGGNCHVFTGQCECQSGFTGSHCEYPCPLGYYGLGCTQKCNCPTSECNNKFGCAIDSVHFESSLSTSYTNEKTINLVTLIVLLLSLFIMLIACWTLWTLLRYKQQMIRSNQKSEQTIKPDANKSLQFENPTCTCIYEEIV